MEIKVGDYVLANNDLDEWNESTIFEHNVPYKVILVTDVGVRVCSKNTKNLSYGYWNLTRPILAEFTKTKLWRILNGENNE